MQTCLQRLMFGCYNCSVLLSRSLPGEYLELEFHCMDVLQLIVEHSDYCEPFTVKQIRVICVDVQMPGHGDVIGNPQAPRTLFISRQNQNHFVPLIRDHSGYRTAAVNDGVDNENNKSSSSTAAGGSNSAASSQTSRKDIHSRDESQSQATSSHAPSLPASRLQNDDDQLSAFITLVLQLDDVSLIERLQSFYANKFEKAISITSSHIHELRQSVQEKQHARHRVTTILKTLLNACSTGSDPSWSFFERVFSQFCGWVIAKGLGSNVGHKLRDTVTCDENTRSSRKTDPIPQKHDVGFKKARHKLNLTQAYSCAAGNCGDPDCIADESIEASSLASLEINALMNGGSSGATSITKCQTAVASVAAQGLADLMDKGLQSNNMSSPLDWNNLSRPNDRSKKRKTPEKSNKVEEAMEELFNVAKSKDEEETNSDADVDSLSDVTESDAMSDDNDMFDAGEMSAEQLPTDYKKCFLYQWQEACKQLSTYLRDDVWLPLQPRSSESVTLDEVQSGILLPPWHCTFVGCCTVAQNLSQLESHENELWSHIWSSSAGKIGAHKHTLLKIIADAGVRRSLLSDEEIAFSLYTEAIAQKSRSNVPLLGLSTDRRALCHLAEVFHEDNIHTLMCFICSCKHIAHKGFSKFGEKHEKGSIAFRTSEINRKRLARMLQCVKNSADEYREKHKKLDHLALRIMW